MSVWIVEHVTGHAKLKHKGNTKTTKAHVKKGSKTMIYTGMAGGRDLAHIFVSLWPSIANVLQLW